MVVQSRFGPGKHYNNMGFVEKENEQKGQKSGGNCYVQKWAPPCVRKWGSNVAQHTLPVLEHNVCENGGGGWKAGVERAPSLSGGNGF